ncbi:hypothetical protein HYT23_00130 [Candidatus Pacearchaeota archaeon]|nr:hypothetical protein [Candidatus Pacearchaeota archaeon]
MEKRVLFILCILSITPLISSATIDTKQSYSQGETIIAKISGNFYDSILESNLFFYRDGYIKIPMSYDVGKVGGDYYLKASLVGKSSGNYTIKIKNARYYENGLITSNEIAKNFTITQELAPFSVNPGFLTANKNFIISIQNLKDYSLDIQSSSPSGISTSQISLSAGQTNSFAFDISGLTESIISAMTLSSSGLSYLIPLQITVVPKPTNNTNNNTNGTNPPSPEQFYCGDGDINVAGETCDVNDFGPISGCSSYGFNSGSISCNAPGTTEECKIDLSNCYTASTVECTIATESTACFQGQICYQNKCTTPNPEPEDIPCGNSIINPGELCDLNNWGGITGCVNWGFDNGTLSCSNLCVFNTSKCFNNIVQNNPSNNTGVITCSFFKSCPSNYTCDDGICVPKPECAYKKDCQPGYDCINDKCIFIGQSCSKNSDCNSSLMECKNDFCSLKVGNECTEDENCAYGYECASGFCIGEAECASNFDCTREFWECVNNQCYPPEEIIECTSNSNCTSSERCVKRTCIEKGDECKYDRNCRADEECDNGECVEKDDLPQRNSTRTCPEINGTRCLSDQYCNGTSVSLGGSACCLARCSKEPSGGGSKIVGWLLIGFLFIILVFFYIKYKRTRRMPPNLAKIGGGGF